MKLPTTGDTTETAYPTGNGVATDDGVRRRPPRLEEPHTYSSRPPRKSKKWIPIVAVLGVLALLAAAFWNRSRQGGGANRAEGPPRGPMLTTVKVVPARLDSIVQNLTVTGALRANQNINLSSKISGRVANVYVQEGNRVQRGQLLVSLENDDLIAQANQARAGLRTAQVRLRQQQVGLPAIVSNVNTSIEQAEAALQTARARYRQAQLQEPARVQEVAAGVERAEAALASAAASYRQAQLQEPASVQAAESQVASARQTVRTAQTRLTQARQTAEQTRRQVEAEIERASAGVAAAQAGVGQARAALAEVERGAREQQIAQAQSQVDVLEAQLRDAQTELNRARILFEGGAAPRSSVDTAQTRYDVTRAQLESARQNLSLVREGATNEQVLQAREAVRQAQAAVTEAEAARAQAETGRSRIPIAQGEITAALAALSQAQEGLRTATANLSQIPISRQQTRIAREAVDQARAQLNTARSAQAQVPITRQETRIAREAVGQAQAALNQARANRSNIPVAREDIAAARAGVDSARAQLEQAEVNLRNARIYAPVSGVINQKLTDVGQSVTPGTSLFNIVALNSVYFEAQVSENNVRRIEEGDTVQVRVPAVADRPFPGFVSDIIPVADPRSRQFRIRVTVPESPRELTPGAFARGEVRTEAIYNALVVPTDAIQTEKGQPTVLVAAGKEDETKVEQRVVKTGLSSAGKTHVLSGLAAGDRVILGNPLLEEGEKVRVASGTVATGS